MNSLPSQVTATPSLRELRRRAGLTQQQLATRAGCSISYVPMLERGLTPARSDVLPRILRALENATTEII